MHSCLHYQASIRADAWILKVCALNVWKHGWSSIISRLPVLRKSTGNKSRPASDAGLFRLLISHWYSDADIQTVPLCKFRLSKISRGFLVSLKWAEENHKWLPHHSQFSSAHSLFHYLTVQKKAPCKNQFGNESRYNSKFKQHMSWKKCAMISIRIARMKKQICLLQRVFTTIENWKPEIQCH